MSSEGQRYYSGLQKQQTRLRSGTCSSFSQHSDDGDILARAIKATFDRRKTDLEKEPLFIFSDEFMQDDGKHTQWKAFLNKNGINSSMEFDQVLAEVQQVIEPVYQSISNNESFEKTWDYPASFPLREFSSLPFG